MNSASRSSPPTDSGATRSTRPRRGSSASHATSNAATGRRAARRRRARGRGRRGPARASPARRPTSSDFASVASVCSAEWVGVAHQRPARRRGRPATGSSRPTSTDGSAAANAAAASSSRSACRSSTCRCARRAGALDHRDGQLDGRRRGRTVDQLVRLVDDHDVVLGQHRDALDAADREQRVVGDDDVALARLLARLLGEALLAVRALLRAEALAARHRVRAPDPVVDVGRPARAGRRSSVSSAHSRSRFTSRPERGRRPPGSNSDSWSSSGAPSRSRCRHR